MGLLDFLSPSFSGGGGGLLDFLRQNGLQQSMPSGLASDQAQYGQPSILGSNQPNSAPAPMQAMAQMPPRMPAAIPPQPPAQPAPAMPQQQQDGPGLGGHLIAGLQSFANSGGIIPALVNGGIGLATGRRADPGAQKAALFQKILGQSDAPGQAGATPSMATDQMSRLTNALLATGDIEGAKKVSEIAGKDKTELIKNFEFAKKGGFPGTLFQYETAIKKAGATNVNTNVNTGEKAYDQALNKSFAEKFMDMQKAGSQAPGALGNLNLMEKLISDPNFYSGTGGEAATKLKSLAVTAGIANADAAAPNELFQKLSQKSVIDAAGGSLGTGFSNADRDFINGTVANISNTPEGNKQIIQIGRQVQQRNIDVARIAREYAKSNGGRIDAGLDEKIAQFAEKNPLFANMGAPAQQSAAPKIRRFNPANGKIE